MPPGYKVCVDCLAESNASVLILIPISFCRSASAICPPSKRGLLWPQIRLFIPSSITLRDHDFWSQEDGYSASVWSDTSDSVVGQLGCV